MFKSLHALQGVLAVQRAEIEQTMGDRPVGVASCEVLDELIARIRNVTEEVAPDMPVTVSGMMTHGGDALELMRLTSAALSQLGTISGECSGAVYALRQPQIELIDVAESQGYAVDPETFTKVTDAQDRDGDDPPFLRRLECEARNDGDAKPARLLDRGRGRHGTGCYRIGRRRLRVDRHQQRPLAHDHSRSER